MKSGVIRLAKKPLGNFTVIESQGVLSEQEVLKVTGGKNPSQMGQHELGAIGERLALERISKIKDISATQLFKLYQIAGIPFDIIARHGEEIWLIEVKTGKNSFGSVQPIQKRRMEIILKNSELRKLNLKAKLFQVKLLPFPGKYRLRNFNTQYQEKGLAQTFEKICKSINNFAVCNLI